MTYKEFVEVFGEIPWQLEWTHDGFVEFMEKKNETF